jgi:hypothetical protein
MGVKASLVGGEALGLLTSATWGVCVDSPGVWLTWSLYGGMFSLPCAVSGQMSGSCQRPVKRAESYHVLGHPASTVVGTKQSDAKCEKPQMSEQVPVHCHRGCVHAHVHVHQPSGRQARGRW